MCFFFDFERKFDMVRHELLMRRLVRLEVDAADLRMLRGLSRLPHVGSFRY